VNSLRLLAPRNAKALKCTIAAGEGIACDIDRYLDTKSIDWDKLDKANYHPDWVLN
jgi:hypothetical protein